MPGKTYSPGDVVVIHFPFSDLSTLKKRPAFVLADISHDDVILCQISSKPTGPTPAISLSLADFIAGGLPINSFVKPYHLFTSDKSLIIKTAGRTNLGKVKEVYHAIYLLFKT